MYKRRLDCIAYHNLTPDDINNLFTKHGTPSDLRLELKLCVLNPKPYMILSLTVIGGIVWNCLPSQLKSKPSNSIKKSSKCIDQNTFGTNSTYTATNNNSDECVYY